MTFNKTQTCCAIAAATFMVGALVSPQAMAHSKAERIAEAANNKADALESQLRAMQAEIDSLRAAASAPQADGTAAKVQELDQWMQQVKSTPVHVDEHHDNTIFFRGGFARLDYGRNDLLTGNQFAGNALKMGTADQDGWYIGAGFDFGLTDDVWGLMDNTQVLAELMFEYKNFGAQNSEVTITTGQNKNTTNPLCTLINLASGDEGIINGAGTKNCENVTVTQLTLTAAPKIKFMKDSDFRPWVIPVGLGIHVISPPSNGVTYINPGVMFAAGADYRVWKDIFIGLDGRYHLTGSDSDGVKLDGLTAGGYIGIGF